MQRQDDKNYLHQAALTKDLPELKKRKFLRVLEDLLEFAEFLHLSLFGFYFLQR